MNNIVYCQGYIAEMTFQDHSVSLVMALIDSPDTVLLFTH